ncbi:MAG: hypothetical protein AABZ74_01890 [Cyanobacteriota bacterium]
MKIKRKKGNALIEFAMVFPLLAVFTMGSVYLSISFGQKAMMNGFAFYEARAMSVRKEPKSSHEMILARYKKDSDGKQPWLEKVKSEVTVNENMLEVVLTKDPVKMDMLYNCLSLLGGKKPTNIKEIKSYINIPYEFVEHNHKGYKSDRSETYNVVDYEAQYALEKGIKEAISGFPDSLKNLITGSIFKKMVDPKTDHSMNDSEKSDMVLSTNQSENMKVLAERLEGTWNIEYKDVTDGGTNSATNEKPKTIDFDTIGNPSEVKKIYESMNFLETTGNHIGKIQVGGVALNVIKDTLPAAKPIGAIVDVMAKGAEIVEPKLTKFSELVSKNNSNLFKDSIIQR